MKWMLDLNVILDVLQQRVPFYQASARILSQIVQGRASGFVAGHGLTTIFYIVRRYADTKGAEDAIDWLLSNLEIAPQDKGTFVRARSLPFGDFEDAALASAAESAGCDHIVTRNVADFASSPVPALTPEELLIALSVMPP